MKLFKKEKEDNSITQYNKDVIMAKEIISIWGEKVQLYSPELLINGGFYNEYVYFQDGLELAYSDLEGLFINYKGENVLNHDEYIAGDWEYILNEIYSKVSKINYYRNSDNNKYDKAIEALYLVDSVGSAIINDSLRIVRDDIRIKNENGKFITTYTVYKDEDLVFSGSLITPNQEKVYVYEQGNWEEEIKDYIKYLFIKREELKKEQTKKLILKK